MRVLAVPIKSLERSKGRLAGTLSPAERAVLTMALLEDVLDACFRQPGWDVAVRSSELAVLLGDLPYLTAGELRHALALPGPVVAAPALSDGGTNLLLRRPAS